MRHYHWLRNTLRNNIKQMHIGKTLTNLTAPNNRSICFVSATRLSEKEFWNKSLLGRSLKPRLNPKTIQAHIAYNNTRGLPHVYNEAIHQASADILVFLHDDVWLEDTQLMPKIRIALRFNDIVGVAGNVRRVRNQPAWLFLRDANGKLELDHPHLSGSIKHGEPGKSAPSLFGPAPATCELMDGVFLAANRQNLLRSRVFFDPQFKFDFYDMDFCRTARKAGFRLSTWPINLIHLSSGGFGGPSWQEMEKAYLAKWQ